MIQAEIITVGTELLLGDILNSNSRFLARELAELGIAVYRHTTVGDNRQRLLEAFESAFRHCDLVITTGGLGPTSDDITREAAAEYFGQPLRIDGPSLNRLEETFRDRPEALDKGNRKQALFPENARILRNPYGTAPGSVLEKEGRRIIILPGPPREMEPMFRNEVRPLIRELSGKTIRSRVLRFLGIAEWDMAARVADLLLLDNPTVAPYTGDGECILRVTALADDAEAADRLMAPVIEEIRYRLNGFCYGEGEEALEERTARLLIEKGLTVSTAESLTGGLLASTLVDCPLGISASFLEGYVTYSNAAKTRDLAVRPETLEQYGAVSAECAREMVLGCQARSGSDVAISTTGIAGPTGGSADKPVGLTYIGLYYKGEVEIYREVFQGPRNPLRSRVVRYALEKLLEKIRAEG